MGLIAALSRWLHPPAVAVGVREHLERACAAIDPLLQTVGGYAQRLEEPVAGALDYCADLVEVIPGPLDVDSHAFASDPLIHAVFGSVDDIAAMIGRSQAVRSFMEDGAGLPGEEFYGLLGMRRYEKMVSGLALQDGFVRNEVPQRLLYFGDHTLSSISGDRDAVRDGLQIAAFDSLVASFAAQIKTRREARQELKLAIDVARARKQDLAPLEARLREAAADLAPQRLVDAFAGWLAEPRKHLRLEPRQITVDRMGVIVADDSDAPGVNTLEFPELVGRDRRQWLVVLARIRREEAAAALASQAQAHRYIVI
jgi:hypothetical protein